MPTKRIKLPSADELLLGRRPAVAGPEAPQHQGRKTLKKKGAKVSIPREHISTYLSTDVLKELEEVKTRLFVQENRKLTKAELIERAIRVGLKKPDELLK